MKALGIACSGMLMLSLASCASAPSAPGGELAAQAAPPTQVAPSVQAGNPSVNVQGKGTGNELVTITPFTSVTAVSTPARDRDFSNAYTRLVIEEAPLPKGDDGELLKYPYHDRGAIARMFWTTHYTLNLTANVIVGNFQATVPLVTIDHLSSRNEGEQFVRVMAHRSMQFPLFLLKGDGSNAVAAIRFVVKSTDDVDSTVAARSIQAAGNIVKVLAPTNAVLTSLTSQQSKDGAQALDKAIDQVMAKKLDEEQWIDDDIRRLTQGVAVTLRIPDANAEGDRNYFPTNLNPIKTVGSWRLSFEAPRPSVFSDIQVCKKDDTVAGGSRSVPPACEADLGTAAGKAIADALSRPEQVLAFQLVSGTQMVGTVAAFLKQSDFWAPALAKVSPPDNKDPTPDDLSSFCRSIRNAVASIGLNNVDAAIIVGAVRDGMGWKANVVKVWGSSNGCKATQSGI